MLNLNKEIKNAKSIGISGHINPDGDCVGSTMALYQYIKKTRPDCDVHIYLDKPQDIFMCIKDADKIEDADGVNEVFDIFFALDCAAERLGASKRLFESAKCTINIDHHVSNPGCGDYNYIVPDASSSSELVYDLLDKDKLDKDIALSLYIGIIHDTGVLQYSCTSPKTLITVSDLISYGFDFPKLIDETFYERTLVESKLLGQALLDSKTFMDGRVIVSQTETKTLYKFGGTIKDVDGIVSQLRLVKGVETAVYIYQVKPDEFKVSLRSNGNVNVSKVCVELGGCGHERAAGVTLKGSLKEVTDMVLEKISQKMGK